MSAEPKKIASVQQLVNLPTTFEYRHEARCKCQRVIAVYGDLDSLAQAINQHGAECWRARGES